jgi:predicted nucleic acid-binding protein
MSNSSRHSLIVIDASALVELLLSGARSVAIGEAVGEARLLAPDLVNPEVMQCLRRLERARKITAERASKALSRLCEGGVSTMPTGRLTFEAWSLRHNLSAYDACYVALARVVRCPLLTADGPLARAPGLGIALIVV